MVTLQRFCALKPVYPLRDEQKATGEVDTRLALVRILSSERRDGMQ